jgi:chromosome segregation ATPase
VAACAIAVAATPTDPANSEEATLQRVESEIERRLTQQLARHAQAQSLQASSDAMLSQVADMQRHLDTDLGSLRAKLDHLFDWARQTDGQIELIESRRKLLDEVQARANGIAHTLQDLDVKLELLGEHRAVVDHVGDKLARLDFTLQEAQNTLRALQREREVAERIEQGLKALRSPRNGAIKPATSQY